MRKKETGPFAGATARHGTVAGVLHDGAQPLDLQKRNFLRYGAAGAATLALQACGGSGDAAELMPDEEVLDDKEDDTPTEEIDPVGDLIDRILSPNQPVPGRIEGRVLGIDGPIAQAAVAVYRQDGVLITQGMTDDEGRYRLDGQALACMRVVVSAPQGELSAFLRDGEGIEDGGDSVTLLTTLVDRLRIAKGWTVSQAEDRMQDYLSIPRLHAIGALQEDTPYFQFASFAHRCRASGMSQDAYLDQIVASAASPDFLAARIQFSALLGASPSPGGLKPIIDKLKTMAGRASTIRSLIDKFLSDDFKMSLADGWFVKMGLFHVDSTSRALAEIQESLISLHNHVADLRKRLEEQELRNIWSELTNAYRPIFNFQQKIETLMRYSSVGDQQSQEAFDNQIKLMLEPNGGLLHEANQYYNDVFMVAFGPRQDETQVLLWRLAKYYRDTKPFWSVDLEIEYRAVLSQIQGYNLTLGLLSVVYLSLKKHTMLEITDQLALISARHQILERLAPRSFVPVDDQANIVAPELQYVFIAHQYGDVAWYVSPALDALYGTWKSPDNLQSAYRDARLPAEVRALGEWVAPSKQEIDSMFFRPISNMPKEERNFRSYMLASGAPCLGFYDKSQSVLQKKKNFTIWLENTRQSVRVNEVARRNYMYYSWSRTYARMGHREFKDSGNQFSCRGVNNRCSFDEAGNSKDKNYLYPVCRAFKDADAFLPWKVFDKVREETGKAKA